MVIEPHKSLQETPLKALDSNQINQTIQPLAQRSMFWRPAYLESSAWLEHIPFAFWLIDAHRPRVFVELGAHYGVSYFAFCQAVEKLGLDTRCFAIDTWKGDNQAGLYDESVFEKVQAHNEAQYSGFSRLVRSTFDAALPYFTDGSIDLLHIDGFHTLESISHDFNAWLPKLSSRAVVVMHDTNVREREFGVFKFFESLKEQYPSFEFAHGHGLGVLQIGSEQNDLLQRLFQSSESEPARRAVHEVFSRLGRACADSFAAAQQQERARSLTMEVGKQKVQLEEFKENLELTRADLGIRSQELAETKARVQAQIEQHASERGQLAERVTLLQEIRVELKGEIARLQERIDGNYGQLQQRGEDLARLERASAVHRQQLEIAETELQGRDHTIASLRQSAEKSLAEIEALQTILFAREREMEAALCTQQAQAAESTRMQEELHGRLAELEQLNEAWAERGAEIERLTATLAGRTQEQYQAQNELRERSATIDDLRQTLETQSQEVQELTDTLAQKNQELIRQGQLLCEKERDLEAVENNHQMLVDEVASLHEELDSWVTEVERLEGVLLDREAEFNQLAEARAAQQAELTRNQSSALEHQSELTKLRRELVDRSGQIGRIEDVVKTRERELAEARASIKDRFRELATLTKLLEERDHALAEGSSKTGRQNEQQVLCEELQAIQKQLDEVQSSGQHRLREKRATIARLEAEKNTIRAEMELHANKSRDAETQKNLVDELRRKLEDVHSSGQSRLKEKDEAIARLGSEKRTLLAEKEAQAKSLNDRFRELAVLTQLLEQREQEITDKVREVEEIKGSLSWRATAPARELAKPFVKKEKGANRLAREMELIQKSGLFDDKWYVLQYPDVAKGNLKPIEHYLKYGAREGRNPNPTFDTQRYSSVNSDVSKLEINALVHYIKFSNKNGR
jgi:hypothetical protein